MDPFVAQIIPAGFNFAPRGWSFCDGALLPIQQNTALFSLLGTTYGGNGSTTFALPNLQDKIAIGAGQGPGLSNYVLGQTAGTENITLVANNLPEHTHLIDNTGLSLKAVTAAGSTTVPTGNYLAASRSASVAGYATTGTLVSMNAASVTASLGVTGQGVAFSIMQPYTTLIYIIARQGVFPSRN